MRNEEDHNTKVGDAIAAIQQYRPSGMSRVNPAFTQKQAIAILYAAIRKRDPGETVDYMTARNIRRELGMRPAEYGIHDATVEDASEAALTAHHQGPYNILPLSRPVGLERAAYLADKAVFLLDVVVSNLLVAQELESDDDREQAAADIRKIRRHLRAETESFTGALEP